jgi:predicted acyl esterase
VKKSGSKTAAHLEALPRASRLRQRLVLARRRASLNAVAVPTLTVGGYYDQEDMFGPQIEYSTLEPHDTNHQNFLVLGPWRHGSWASSRAHLGNLDYTEPIGKEFAPRSKPNSSPTT